MSENKIEFESPEYISLWGVKQNNLKNISVQIPLGNLTVVCGPSGSGKSSIAFETLFAEGQRRFIESMSNYARQFLSKAPKPNIEGIENIPPSISIEQKNSIKSSRSTVGTVTEIIEYLRLFFEKAGQSFCPIHNVPTLKASVTSATDLILTKLSQKKGYILFRVDNLVGEEEKKRLIGLLIQDGYSRIFVSKAKKETSAASTSKSSKSKASTSKSSLLKSSIAKSSVEKSSKETSQKLSTKMDDLELIEIPNVRFQKKGGIPGEFYVVVDRMGFSEEDRGRLSDSVNLGFEGSLKYASARVLYVLTTENEFLRISEDETCPHCDYQPPVISSKLFNFNSPIGACPTCKGFGNILTIDEKKVVPNPGASIEEGALNPFMMPSAARDLKALLKFCKTNEIAVDIPWQDLPKKQRDLIWKGSKEFFGVVGLFEYLEQLKYKMHVRVFISRYRSPFTCPDCLGSRLRPETNNVRVVGKNISDLSNLTIKELYEFFRDLKLSPKQMEVSGEIFRQLQSRFDFLMRVGVHYLTLRREARTLSGGEYQRLVLANQLGMGLTQVLYVLDEPTVGLHPRDSDRLISVLKSLRDIGNTIVVVEHDRDVIKKSDYLLEMGPGSGFLGGEVVFAGSTQSFFDQAPSTATGIALGLTKKSSSGQIEMKLDPVTEKQLQIPKGLEMSAGRKVQIEDHKYSIHLTGASGNNLKKINLTLPLHRLVAVTGVSGSGKSTLITKTLFPALAAALKIEFGPVQPFEKIEGVDFIKNVLLIDQSSIGKSARSSPITYLKAFDGIRALMAATPDGKSRGYTPGTFSLNVDGGRCPACRGTGFEEIDMMFMDNVIIPCDVCDGKKYRSDILEIKLRGKNIFEILSMTVNEAMSFFVANPNVRRPLSLLKEVGLDYLQIGQPASSLSGGESQRLKIARELAMVDQTSTLYILDEPTTGLHFHEVDLLMKVLHRLVEAGGSVVVVEHNLDVIRHADYVLDLGPEGGEGGGQIVFAGHPSDLIRHKTSLTGLYLKKLLDAEGI